MHIDTVRFWLRTLLVPAFLSIVANISAMNTARSQDGPCPVTQTVDTLDEMWTALYACWQPPADSDGLEITLTFSLRRNGTMISQPRVSWSKLAGDSERQRAFVASVLNALEKSLPLPLSDGMGGAIAGRPLALRFRTARQKSL
jgi:hypothetical protein